jgi:uracil-DNA glycosylase
MDVHTSETEPIKSLRQLAAAEAGCTRCPLYHDATQALPARAQAGY